LVKARADEWDAITGALVTAIRVVERLVSNVGYIHQHAEAIHLEDDLLAAIGETIVVLDLGIVDVSPEESAHSLVFDQLKVM